MEASEVEDDVDIHGDFHGTELTTIGIRSRASSISRENPLSNPSNVHSKNNKEYDFS